MIAADSGVWIDHLRGDATPEVTRLRDIIASEKTLPVVCDAVLFEVLRGVRHDAQAARHGFTAGRADALIADWCLDRGHRLLHDDGASDRMEALPGLRVERP